MDTSQSGTRSIALLEGEQLVVNGALVTADCDCKLTINGSASLLAPKDRPAAGKTRPAHQLYFSVMELVGKGTPVSEKRAFLFSLLAEIVAEQRTSQGQEDCTALANALLAKDEDALMSAARTLALAEAGNGLSARRAGVA